MTRKSGFELIPDGAKFFAVLVFGAADGLSWRFFAGQNNPLLGALMGGLGGAFLAAFILLSGYIYADAPLRGMPAIPWTLLALLIPNGLGFVLYFLLRKPILHPCPRCAQQVPPDAAFCPRCGQPQTEPRFQEPSRVS